MFRPHCPWRFVSFMGGVLFFTGCVGKTVVLPAGHLPPPPIAPDMQSAVLLNQEPTPAPEPPVKPADAGTKRFDLPPGFASYRCHSHSFNIVDSGPVASAGSSSARSIEQS